MKYEEFKTEIVKSLKEFYGGNADVELVEALKNNGKKRNAVNIRINDENSSIAPVIDLGEFFRMFNTGSMDMERCIKDIVKLREESSFPPQIVQFSNRLFDWESVRGKVYPALLRTEENRELLKKLVSRNLLDLSVVYIIRETADRGSSYSVKVTGDMLKVYGINEEQLYKQAIHNLERDDYHFCEIRAHIQRIIDGGDNGEEQEQKNVDRLENGKMYILRNASGLYGAAGILNGKLIQNTTKGHDCFILPSSIHETIFLLVSNDYNQKELDGMVAEINEMCVDEEERLADHSYYYDAKAGEIRICA